MSMPPGGTQRQLNRAVDGPLERHVGQGEPRWCEFRARLETDDAIPVRYVHIEALEFTGKLHAVVRNEMANLLHLIHSLLEPVLGRNYLEVLPLVDDYLS